MLKRSAPLTRKTPLRATGFRRTPQGFAGQDRQGVPSQLLMPTEWAGLCFWSPRDWNRKCSRFYAVAQDVASAIKLFRGELFYDTAKGIPYWTEVLGQLPPLALVRERLRVAALTVPDVADAVPTITAFENRRLSGYVEVTLTNGTTSTITF